MNAGHCIWSTAIPHEHNRIGLARSNFYWRYTRPTTADMTTHSAISISRRKLALAAISLALSECLRFRISKAPLVFFFIIDQSSCVWRCTELDRPAPGCVAMVFGRRSFPQGEYARLTLLTRSLPLAPEWDVALHQYTTHKKNELPDASIFCWHRHATKPANAMEHLCPNINSAMAAEKGRAKANSSHTRFVADPTRYFSRGIPFLIVAFVCSMCSACYAAVDVTFNGLTPEQAASLLSPIRGPGFSFPTQSRQVVALS